MYCENVTIPAIEIIRERFTEQDYLELKNSGLTDEQIVQTGHFSIPDKKTAYQLTGINHRGLCFRYYDPSGSPYKSNGGKDFYRMKPRDWKENTSQQIDILDDPPKYLTEKDGGCKPYFSALYPHWKIAIKRTKTTLYITEGEKKADCLCGHGKAAIGLSGVWGWMDKQGRTGEYDLPAPQELEDDEEAQEQIGKLETSRVLPELAEIDWKYRRVVLCFDSDLTQKKPVKQALKQLAVWLTKQGAEPEILLLPTEIDGSKNGADDLIVRHGITAFEILDHFTFSAITYQKKIPLLNLPRDPILPLKAAMTEAVFKDSWRFRPNVGWYQWTGRCWKHNDSGSGVELEGELIKFINANSWIYQGSSNLTSLVRQLKAKLQKADWESPYKLAFSNGTLNLKTGEFIPEHLREDFLTSALPYQFNPNAQCPKWLQFLNEALGGDNSVIGLLQAFFKWIVTPKTSALKIEKCLDLIGQPGTGKGTTLDILHAFAGGTENCAVIDSDTFNKSGENLASLLDKKVSIDSDASGFISNIGLFCKVVSNEPVRSRKLYKDTMNVRLNTVIVRAYNRFLDVQGATEALNRRIIAIPFDIKPDEPDIGLRSQLLEELPGIFAWAWSISEAEMKRRILWPGDSPAIASASTRRFEANNPEFTFLREIFPDGKEAVQPRGLYSTYKDWCKDVGISPKKERNFYDTIRPFGCEQGNKSDGYRHFSIPPMKDFDIMAHIGMRQPEKNASAKKVLPLVSPYLPIPCPEQVSAPSFLPDVSPPISPSDSGRNQGETDKTFLPDSNPVPVRHRELGRNEDKKFFTAVKTGNGMTAWEKLQRERGAVFYSDVPREPQFQVGQMVWWEGKEYRVEHATELRINIELPDGIIKSVQNEEIAIKNWQVGDRCFVTSASESGEVLELCNDSLTFRVRLDSGEIAGYWANDLVLDPAAPLPETVETTVEPAVEATPVTQKESKKSRRPNWQVGDYLVAEDRQSARIIRIDPGLTYPILLQFDNGKQRHYSADDLELYNYRKKGSPGAVELQPVSAKLEAPGADTISTVLLPETTVEQAIEATEVTNLPPTDEGDTVRQQQAELNAFGAKLSAKYNELERILPSKTLETAEPTVEQVSESSPKVGEHWAYKEVGMVRFAVVEIKAIWKNIYRWYDPQTGSFGDCERHSLHKKVLPSKTSEAAPPTGKFKVGDRVRSHDQIGTILEVKNESSVIVYWDDKAQTRSHQRFLSGKTAEGGELLPAPRGVANYLSLKPGDRVRILRHSKHKPRWYQKGGKVVTIKATRINPKTYELEANADIAGEGLPCTLSLDAVEVVN